MRKQIETLDTVQVLWQHALHCLNLFSTEIEIRNNKANLRIKLKNWEYENLKLMMLIYNPWLIELWSNRCDLEFEFYEFLPPPSYPKDSVVLHLKTTGNVTRFLSIFCYSTSRVKQIGTSAKYLSLQLSRRSRYASSLNVFKKAKWQ